MAEPQPQPESCEAGYRVKKISIRRGYAIDQIKFEYSDHKVWSVGIEGGRKDNRDFIMTPGEYLVRVTHETLRQRLVSSLSFHLYEELLTPALFYLCHKESPIIT